MVNHPILEETHQFLHINARLHRVLAPGIEEIVLLLAVVQAGHIAMLALAIHNARPYNRQFAVRFLCLPNLVDFLRHQLADAVWRAWRRQRVLRFQLLRRTIGRNGTGEEDFADAVLLRKGGHILRAANVRLEIGVIRMSRRPVHRRKVENHIIRRGREIKGNRLTHIHAAIDNPLVFLHDAGHNAFFAGHDQIQIVNAVAGLYARILQAVNQVCADEAGTAENQVIHCFALTSRRPCGGQQPRFSSESCSPAISTPGGCMSSPSAADARSGRSHCCARMPANSRSRPA